MRLVGAAAVADGLRRPSQKLPRWRRKAASTGHQGNTPRTQAEAWATNPRTNTGTWSTLRVHSQGKKWTG
jgi:hypothetical protein